MAFCGAVETLLDVEVPPRAQYLRVIHLELNRIMSHLVWLGDERARPRRDLDVLVLLPRARDDPRPVRDVLRPADAHALLPGRRRVRGHPAGLRGEAAQVPRRDADAAPTSTPTCSRRTRSCSSVCTAPARSTSRRCSGLGVTGPLLRAAGNPWDLRKAAPYSSYDHFEFKIPVGTVGDNYDRYRVRHAELYESVKIIGQALEGLPEGPFITPDRKVALPPRHELATSMEALIHHFKLVTEGFRVPPGEAYYPIEGPRGELGCFVRADGSAKPARVHMRDPSFVNLQALAPMVRDCVHRRPDRDAGDARSDPRRHRPMSTGRPTVPRFGHGSRVPGWDDAVDLTKDPAVIPDPATTPVPDELRGEIEAAMARYPDRRSAAIPALHAAQAVHGWCSPEAIDQVAAVMRLTPAYLTSVATFYDMLETEPRPKHDDVYVCTNISCSLLGADELFEAMVAAAAGDATSTCARSSASAPATSRRWRRSTASTSAR